MKLNRKLVLFLSLVLSLALATGGTLAYLSDTDADVNTMTLGNVYIVQNEQQRNDAGELVPFENNQPAYPAVGSPVKSDVMLDGVPYRMLTEMENVIDKIVTVTNTGKSDAYVRTFVAIEAVTDNPMFNDDPIYYNSNSKNFDLPTIYENILTIDIDGRTYLVLNFTYPEALAAGETSMPSLLQVYLGSEATNEDVEALGETWEVLVLSQAVQTAGFADAETALDTAFGEANATNVAKWMGKGDGSQLEVGSPGDKNPNNNPPVFAEIWVDSDAALAQAIADGHTVIGLKAGKYDINNAKGAQGLTLIGDEGTVLTPRNEGEDGADYGFDSSTLTFNNITFDTTASSGNYRGYARMSAVYNNCDFIGTYTTYAGENEFNNCTFDTKNNYVWTWGATKIAFNNCTFDSEAAKAILVHGATSSEITVNNCQFIAKNAAYTWDNIHVAAVSIDPVGSTYTVKFVGENTYSDCYNGLHQVKYANEADSVTIVE